MVRPEKPAPDTLASGTMRPGAPSVVRLGANSGWLVRIRSDRDWRSPSQGMKHLLEKFAAALRPAPAEHSHHTGGHKVFVRIDQPLMADRRLRKYQQPLHSALMLARLGHVTGGGSVQGTDGTIQWISIDMRLRDLDGALHFACAKLRELGAPARSIVKFERDGKHVVQSIA